MKTIAQKLLIKPGSKICVYNIPSSVDTDNWGMEETLQVRKNADIVIAFANNKTELDSYTKKAISSVKSGGIVWICYPKGSSKVKTDINRDTGWEVMQKFDWHGVAQASIDDTWSALRFRPRSEIKQMTRKF